VPAWRRHRGDRPGFTAAMMLTDRGLAPTAAQNVAATTPCGALAHQRYRLFARKGNEMLDFSAIISMIEQRA